MNVFSRLRTRWSHDLQFRLTIGLSALIILLMLAVAFFTVTRQHHILQQAAEARALAFSRTFASIGAVAMLENLFRIQESMERYLDDPTIINIDVVDEDNLIVSSRNADRIGLELSDSLWQAVTASRQEAILPVQGSNGGQALLLANPLFEKGEILAWVRIEVSLAQMQQEKRQAMLQIGILTLVLVAFLVGALRLALRKYSQVLEGVHGPLGQALSMLGGVQQTHPNLVGDKVESSTESPRGQLEEMATVVSETTTLLLSQSETLRDFMISLEQKVAERTAELRSTQERFRAVVEHAAEGIITIDEYGQIQTFNPAASSIFGYVEHEVLKQNINILMPSPDHEQRDSFLARCRQTGTGAGEVIGIGQEVVGRRKNGAMFPVDLSLSEMIVDGHRMFTGLVRDITERKRMEAVVAEARDAALESARLKTEFLATMSHEIRTPMNGVIGMTGILLDTELTAEQRDCAEIVKNSGEALLTIINDILDFSKIEAGKLDLEVIDFDLRSAVEEVLDLLAERAAAKNLELVGLVYGTVPTGFRGDPGRLRQILINLLGNAIKFTEQGEVVVQVTHLDETEEDVRVRFDITDTGVGISPEGQSRLFQSFSQADSSTTRKFGGTGLGLAICKSLVEAMQGELGVDSLPGQGSWFWFTVVLGKQEKKEQVLHPSQDLKNLRVCIVDDNGTNRTLLQHYSDQWGMRCVSVGSGSEALMTLQAAKKWGEPCDLMIVDQQMPGMDGIELARRIKAQPEFSSVRVVMLTSLGSRGAIKLAGEVGISGYLTKPVRREQLYQCLTRVMGMSHHEQEERETQEHPVITLNTLKEEEARQRIRILVAEDNIVNQKVAVRLLEKLGYRADVVANGNEAVEALGRIPYNLILMDCQMPEMDGYEATVEIRKREALSVMREASLGNDEIRMTNDEQQNTLHASRDTLHVPIIALTANAMMGDREKCLEAGMDDFASKPVKLEELEAVLERWVLKRETETREVFSVKREASDGDHEIRNTNDEIRAMSEGSQDPSLNAATIDRLKELGGDDPSFLTEVILQFLHEGPDHVAVIRHTVRDGNVDALMNAAHTFKGSCRNMGALLLGDLCFFLEQKGRTGEANGLEDVLKELEHEYSRVHVALEAELASLHAGSER